MCGIEPRIHSRLAGVRIVVFGENARNGSCYTASMSVDAIYLDHNATTPLLPEVAEAMRVAALEFPANPASQHRPGQQARRALEDCREQITRLLGGKTTGMDADRLVFTSGGTEANNLAILGMLADQPPGHLVTSAIEHPSLLGPVGELERRSWAITRVPADIHGLVRPDEIANSLRDDSRLVSIMAANNETGVLQPIKEIAQLCADHGVPFHSDAAQWVGKLNTQFHAWQLSSLSCAAHKFGGPLGVGALLLRHDVPLAGQLHGGHQQEGLRPGTESVPLAAGMLAALEIWQRDRDAQAARLTAFRDQFEALITAEIPSAVVIGAGSPRLSQTSNIAFVGLDRQALFLALDLAGVACSTGSACASGSSQPSPVLLGMGLSNELIGSALRFSFGITNTDAEAAESTRRIINAHKQLRR
jgi:cysteine desulfurase